VRRETTGWSGRAERKEIKEKECEEKQQVGGIAERRVIKEKECGERRQVGRAG
jgi:hypothetical protein